VTRDEAVVVCGSTGTTEISVLVTVLVVSPSLTEGVTVTVTSCVLVTVVCDIGVGEPPSIGTIEYVSRGRRA
jgi:hypothetical protein